MNADSLKNQNTSELFQTLLQVMQKLRGPSGCPWDKKQSHHSLIPYLVEECYELIAALETGNPQAIREELGDVLLQIIFHNQIAEEEKSLTMNDILRGLIQKLLRRHPHVFANDKVEDAETAIANWEKIKLEEKKSGESLLSGIPLQLPALLRAYRLGAKVSRVGFDWKHFEEVLAKVEEELLELHQEIKKQDVEKTEEEFGDLLFSLAQCARFLHINPEEALRKSSLKFQKRFEWMEAKLCEEKRRITEASPEELEALWKQAKSSTGFVKKL